MKKGKVKMFFPGGNTCRGFYSFYDNIIDEKAAHIFVLKGGPGVGKSTFMKKIAAELLELGFDLEYHWCSSDSESLDALVVPALGVALLDGTAPHRVVSTQETADEPLKIMQNVLLERCFHENVAPRGLNHAF
ncbi:MAG: hypothetical protein PWQ99_133 [Clostridia bacterium]|jgi:Mrp family chromosome partitioning ATPase|nr:hypothetical protein [Clostridia bacterium]MDN5365474.1 hypothetical protein [Thermacetogenium sp.]MDN5375012.1 hypothetical protein [Thermacetogenium sp.]